MKKCDCVWSQNGTPIGAQSGRPCGVDHRIIIIYFVIDYGKKKCREKKEYSFSTCR